MDGQEEVLVCRCADDIGSQECRPRQERSVSQCVGTEELQADNTEHDRDCQRLRAAEFQNL
jgi:hypothetical protein